MPMNYLGMDKTNFSATVEQLNHLLANYHVYYQNLRNFHWNVKGENFFALHERFEQLYKDARTSIDEIAERIMTLRFRPMSSMSEYLEEAEIQEAGMTDDDRQMVVTLLENHRILVKNMRDVIETADEAKDEGTIDLIAGYLEKIEKQSWMLEAWTVRKLEKTH